MVQLRSGGPVVQLRSCGPVVQLRSGGPAQVRLPSLGPVVRLRSGGRAEVLWSGGPAQVQWSGGPAQVLWSGGPAQVWRGGPDQTVPAFSGALKCREPCRGRRRPAVCPCLLPISRVRGGPNVGPVQRRTPLISAEVRRGASTQVTRPSPPVKSHTKCRQPWMKRRGCECYKC